MSNYYDPEMMEQKPPSACNRIVCYGWKAFTFLVSHIALIALVVSYCLIGAKMFESLEQGHEKEIKQKIVNIRNNITNQLWNLTVYELALFEESNYTNSTIVYLRDFESEILKAITKEGWDGNDKIDEYQWTFEGALFYSIIVITTIGYGHIAPRTNWGKVATIFYAIVGIPLMLLCLSNVGDILATSFRFLYWKVCCYVCTKKPRKRRSRSRTVLRSSRGRYTRSRTTSFRRSMRTSTRSADSGFVISEVPPSSYSDTDLSRYHDDYPPVPSRGGLTIPKMKQSQYIKPLEVPPYAPKKLQSNLAARGGSLDRRKATKNLDSSLEPIILASTQVLCNKYVVNPKEAAVNHAPDPKRRTLEKQMSAPGPSRATSSLRSHSKFLDLPEEPSLPSTSQTSSLARKKRSPAPPSYTSSPRIMSPMGFGHRQKYLDESEYESEYHDSDYSDTGVFRTKPVPIWLCLLLVLSYIIAGMFLFHYWEGWHYLDAAYFCFITLTTIGFGDFVPAKRANPQEAKMSIALSSLYLLFGIALLAMSFNLVQEEVLTHVRRIAKTLGILKEENEGEEEDEEE